MSAKRFALAGDSFDQREHDAVLEVLRSTRYTMGERVLAFEQAFAAWVGAQHAIMVNSGSSANLLMVEALLRRSSPGATLPVGSEVLVPALSWPTTVWPLVQLGLVPVFVDIDPLSLAIDLQAAQQALSPQTKGMFLIHVLGRACEMQAYTAFCRKHGLVLLEDCCETLGAFDHGRHVGTFGQAASYSHFYSHHLTTIEGGTIVTDDAALADDLRSLRAHGWIRDRSDRAAWLERRPDLDPRFFFVSTGYNVRPMEIQAAIGLVQLDKLEGFLQRREALATRVAALLQVHTPWLKLVGADCLVEPELAKSRPRSARTHAWMNLPLVLHEQAPVSRVTVVEAFEQAGVETRPIIAGNLARHPAIERVSCRMGGPLLQADRILARGLMIGCHPGSSADEFACVEAALATLARLARTERTATGRRA